MISRPSSVQVNKHTNTKFSTKDKITAGSESSWCSGVCGTCCCRRCCGDSVYLGLRVVGTPAARTSTCEPRPLPRIDQLLLRQHASRFHRRRRRSNSSGSVATRWTAVDMSTPLLPEVAPEIDTYPTSFYRRRGRGVAPPPDPRYRLALDLATPLGIAPMGAARRYVGRRQNSRRIYGRVRGPHISGGRPWLRCRQPACLEPRQPRHVTDRRTDRAIPKCPQGG